MKIKHHIVALFLVPTIGILAVVGLMAKFSLAEYPFMIFAPIIGITIVILLGFATQFLHVSCPQCNQKLTFNNSDSFKTSMYECENCGFKRKGLFKQR